MHWETKKSATYFIVMLTLLQWNQTSVSLRYACAGFRQGWGSGYVTMRPPAFLIPHVAPLFSVPSSPGPSWVYVYSDDHWLIFV